MSVIYVKIIYVFILHNTFNNPRPFCDLLTSFAPWCNFLPHAWSYTPSVRFHARVDAAAHVNVTECEPEN